MPARRNCYNTGFVRSILSSMICAALLFALVQAPAFHVHRAGQATEHVESEHRHRRVTHSHLVPVSRSAPLPSGPLAKATEADLSAVEIALLRSESPRNLHTDVSRVPEAVIGVAADTGPSFGVYGLRPRVHDPPQLSSRIPRAPPV